jgi:hypothetical protein
MSHNPSQSLGQGLTVWNDVNKAKMGTKFGMWRQRGASCYIFLTNYQSRRISWARHVARMGEEERCIYDFGGENCANDNIWKA